MRPWTGRGRYPNDRLGAVDGSYNLLDPTEQRVFRRVGVSVDGCTVEAAEVVSNALGDLTTVVLDSLIALVDKSLLRQVEHGEGEPRFRMLETVREYAGEQLEVAWERETVHDSYAAYFLRLAEAAAPELTGPAQVAYLRQLETEHNNLRAVLHWMLERGQVEKAARIAAALGRFWYTYAHLNEGRTWLDCIFSRDGPTLPAGSNSRPAARIIREALTA